MVNYKSVTLENWHRAIYLATKPTLLKSYYVLHNYVESNEAKGGIFWDKARAS